MNEISLGIDVGNGTIKLVLYSIIHKDVLDYVYLKNLGVIQTIQEGLKILKGKNLDIKVISCGITGAGRKLASKIVGSDITGIEIFAFLVGCLRYVPEANTLFDLGQEDSKIIFVKDKTLNDFSINDICGGGCGAYLETIALRFNVKIEDFGKIALRSTTPCNISGKCAVFGISSCVDRLNSGARIEDIFMGVAKSLIRNYLNMLGKGRDLKPSYVLGGGVSLNQAVIKALEEELKEEVIVPKYPEVLSAIGIAILAYEESKGISKFRGFRLDEINFGIEKYYCQDCPNICEITKILEKNKIVNYTGSKCEKYN